MNIKTIITTCLLGIGLTMASVGPADARTHHKHHHHKVVRKHKVKHHRHSVGLRHVGKGTRVKSETKVK